MDTSSSDEESSQSTHEDHACTRNHHLTGCSQSDGDDTDMISVLKGSGLTYDDLPELETVSNLEIDEDDDYQEEESKEKINAYADLLFEGLFEGLRDLDSDPQAEPTNESRSNLQTDEERINQ